MPLQVVQFEDPGPVAGQLVVRNSRNRDVNAPSGPGLEVQHPWVADKGHGAGWGGGNSAEGQHAPLGPTQHDGIDGSHRARHGRRIPAYAKALHRMTC